MKSFDSENATLIVLKRGEELIETLNNYAEEHQLQGAWINVIGGAGKAVIGYFHHEKREYVWREFEEPLEITGLQGNLAWVDGQPFWHIHGTFSREDGSVIGGHVKECVISLTGEVYLQQSGQQLTRVFDEDTGLKLLT